MILITGEGLNVTPSMNLSGSVSLLPPSVKAQFTVGASESLDVPLQVVGGGFGGLDYGHELYKE